MSAQPSTRLTDVQRDLVAKHLKLALFLLNRTVPRPTLRLLDNDEQVSAAYLALCYAVLHHDPAKGSLSTILRFQIRGILCREVRELIRKRRRPMVSLDASEIPLAVTDDDPTDPVSQSEDFCALRAALPKLREREREVIERRYFQGQSQKAIGAALGVSGVRAQQIEIRGLDRLRSLMGLKVNRERTTRHKINPRFTTPHKVTILEALSTKPHGVYELATLCRVRVVEMRRELFLLHLHGVIEWSLQDGYFRPSMAETGRPTTSSIR